MILSELQSATGECNCDAIWHAEYVYASGRFSFEDRVLPANLSASRLVKRHASLRNPFAELIERKWVKAHKAWGIISDAIFWLAPLRRNLRPFSVN